MDRTTWLGLMTAGQVQDLMDESMKAGDLAMVSICEDALECDRVAQEWLIEAEMSGAKFGTKNSSHR